MERHDLQRIMIDPRNEKEPHHDRQKKELVFEN
jgi:hypothetical protein